jgi:hypothetical protein
MVSFSACAGDSQGHARSTVHVPRTSVSQDDAMAARHIGISAACSYSFTVIACAWFACAGDSDEEDPHDANNVQFTGEGSETMNKRRTGK